MMLLPARFAKKKKKEVKLLDYNAVFKLPFLGDLEELAVLHHLVKGGLDLIS